MLIRNSLVNTHFKRIHANIILLLFFLTALFIIFNDYYKLDKQVELYQVINDNSYNAIKFLETYPKSVVLAPVHTSTAVYPLSGHDVVATLYFYGINNRKVVEAAYFSGNCSKVYGVAEENNASFILADFSMEGCGWNEVYKEGYYVYKI